MLTTRVPRVALGWALSAVSAAVPLAVPLVVMAAPAVAQESSGAPLTTQDLFRMKLVSAATIAPDGSSIAWTVAVPRDPLGGKDGPSWSELWVAGADGKPRPFITGEVNVSGVQFAPDSKRLLFLAKRTGDKARSLYALPLDGGEAQKLYEHESDLGSVAFHPTLERIAFTTTPADKERKAAQDKGYSQEVFEEDWRAAELHVVDLSLRGSKPQRIPLDGHPNDVEWSPDGRRLLLALAPDPGVDASYMRRRLHILEAPSGEVVAKLDHEGKLGMSTFSPSGRLVAFISAKDKHDPQQGRLMVANAAGGFTKELLPDFLGHFVSAAFLDDDTLLYLADRGCDTLIGRIEADGSGNVELLTEPGFAITSLSLSDDGKRAALVAHAPDFANELFAWEVGGAKQRVTTLNPWLAERQLAAQDVVRWKARDGLEIEGLLVWPHGRKPGEASGDAAGAAGKVPLVVIVHGGPESHYRHGWTTRYSEPAQVLAGKGYAVFLPNYRASTGRGVAFSTMGYGDPAGKEFDDILDGIDFLVAKGLVDAAKVGVTGGSYGGFASAWFATKETARFAAAVMGFGVSNQLSMAGTSDIPEEHYLVHHGKHIWDDWQHFLERSPIYHAPKSKTPLLILAGKADPRVPASQSMELFRYLKVAGHPAVRLVQYPGEGHGNARAASRLDYHVRQLQWFDHYLKGAGGPPPAMELDYKWFVTGQATPKS